MFDPASDRANPAFWNRASHERLPGHLGVEVTAIGAGAVEGRLAIAPHHLAPNGYLHAATVIGLADTLCGYGCSANLPEGAAGFTTIELKANFLGTATEGAITARATMLHGGRTTQVWDADVLHAETGRRIAAFRCTQAILWPRP
ncbi:PaaI family thioesterase [Tepidiforma sp.]|uniref:PaaI family thioesterase n=1 Tax=Tepidiforma sp. TaxID=2682230 RepID=UPI002ADE7DBA|nr:PaaI family thioesterase [Tepidiforma sp.]